MWKAKSTSPHLYNHDGGYKFSLNGDCVKL